MKNIFKIASLLAAAVMLFSCHGYYDPNDPANGGSGGPVDDGVLRIKSDKNLIQTFGGDHATLTVTLGSKVITEGVTFFDDMEGVTHNYSYFPIFINAKKYGMTRDELYFKMKSLNVLGRRYFYPLISEFSTYRGLESANPENLPKAHKMANSVICLPMHHALSEEDVKRVIDCIQK